jgi:hypothetical protein
VGKFIVDYEEVNEFTARSLITAGDGKRLWACVKDDDHWFEVERSYSGLVYPIVYTTGLLKDAVDYFNEN